MERWLDEIRERLDTETKSKLCPESPDKLLAIGTEGYSLLLLEKGADERRIELLVASIRKQATGECHKYPFIVARRLTLDDAIAGQLALACCDCVSALVRDELLGGKATEMFRQLFDEVMTSREFQLVDVRIDSFPQTDAGRRVCWQFFGLAAGLSTPVVFRMFRKKARMLMIWASELNAIVLSNEV